MSRFSDFSTKIEGDIIIISVHLTRATCKDAELLNELLTIALYNKKHILVDLNETEFIDSTFLGVLVINLKKLIEKSGRLGLVGIQESVQMVIARTELLKVFEIYPTIEEALKSMNLRLHSN